MKKKKILYYYLIALLIATFGSFLWQLFMPEIANKFSTWSMSVGWQREIALWNLGMDAGIILTLIKKNDYYAEILTFIGTILCILLGGNHFISALTAVSGNTLLHWVGTFEVLLAGGGFGIVALIKSEFLKFK
jgi:hypothetical protein